MDNIFGSYDKIDRSLDRVPIDERELKEYNKRIEEYEKKSKPIRNQIERLEKDLDRSYQWQTSWKSLRNMHYFLYPTLSLVGIEVGLEVGIPIYKGIKNGAHGPLFYTVAGFGCLVSLIVPTGIYFLSKNNKEINEQIKVYQKEIDNYKLKIEKLQDELNGL